jgi:hypothetical protein
MFLVIVLNLEADRYRHAFGKRLVPNSFYFLLSLKRKKELKSSIDKTEFDFYFSLSKFFLGEQQWR